MDGRGARQGFCPRLFGVHGYVGAVSIPPPFMRIALALILGLFSPTAGADDSAFSGVLHAPSLGWVELSRDGKTIRGRSVGEGACQFAPSIEVLRGEVDGNAMAGTVLVCQQGPGCSREQAYPFFAIWKDGVLTGRLKIFPNCAIPQGNPKHFQLSKKALGDVAGRPNQALLEQRARAVFEEGQQRFAASDYVKAAESFEVAVFYAASEWYPRFALGMAHFRSSRFDLARSDFRKANELALASTATDDDHRRGAAKTLYYLGITEDRLGNLEAAVDAIVGAAHSIDAAAIAKDMLSDEPVAVAQNPEVAKVMQVARGSATSKRTTRP